MERLITFIIQQSLHQMSCSTQMIRNSDVISSKIAHGTSKTAEWIVTQSEHCNPTSTKVAIGRLWSEYEKLRKNKSKTDGNTKFTEFLETEFAPPKLSKTFKPILPEATYLINCHVHIKLSFYGKPESNSGKNYIKVRVI